MTIEGFFAWQHAPGPSVSATIQTKPPLKLPRTNRQLMLIVEGFGTYEMHCTCPARPASPRNIILLYMPTSWLRMPRRESTWPDGFKAMPRRIVSTNTHESLPHTTSDDLGRQRPTLNQTQLADGKEIKMLQFN